MGWRRSLGAVLLLSAWSAPTNAQQKQPTGPSHPVEVALVDEGELGSVYRRFPTGERLYTYNLDPSGKSVCNLGCSSAWPPVLAPADAAAVGDWTVVQRDDGTRQWALKGKPVYVRFHDTPDRPTGHGLKGLWHLVPHTRIAANPAL